jgi:hypothetical protein
VGQRDSAVHEYMPCCQKYRVGKHNGVIDKCDRNHPCSFLGDIFDSTTRSCCGNRIHIM